MMKNSIAIAGALALAFGVANAQNESGNQLDRQVDVTRDYRPTVDRAAKLSVTPNMVDTAQLRPEFDYTIKPTPINHGFGVTALSPVRVNASTYDPLYPFYLKVGGGYPMQSLADLYLNSTGRGRNSWGLYLNHTGRYNKIKNDLGFKNKATKTVNSVGVTGNVGIGRMNLGGEIGFDYDQYSRYGQFNYSGDNAEGKIDVETQKLMTPHATVKLGHDFADLSHLNFGLELGGSYFQDDFSNSEIGIQGELELARMIGEHQVSLAAGYKGATGRDALEDYTNHIVNVYPQYNLVNDVARIGIGCNFAFDIMDDKTEVVVLPSFSISFPGQPRIIPFVDLESRIEQNSYRALIKKNPYVNERAVLPENTHVYDGRAGIEGSFSGVFGYRVYGGVSILRDAAMFANAYSEGNSSTFMVFTEEQVTRYMGAVELEGRMASNLSVMLRGRYFGYSTKTYDKPGGLPNFDVALKFKWNYHSRFFVTAGLDCIGDRHFMEFLMPTSVADPDSELSFVKVKPVADVSLELEYRLQKTLGIFVSGHNLAGSKLYPFDHYPDSDMRINAGVKLLF